MLQETESTLPKIKKEVQSMTHAIGLCRRDDEVIFSTLDYPYSNRPFKHPLVGHT